MVTADGALSRVRTCLVRLKPYALITFPISYTCVSVILGFFYIFAFFSFLLPANFKYKVFPQFILFDEHAAGLNH